MEKNNLKFLFIYRLIKSNSKMIKRRVNDEKKESTDNKIVPFVLSNAITTYGMLQGGRLKLAK